MVHEKFIRKGGKTYGPYYYESYRENGKVKKRYFKSLPLPLNNYPKNPNNLSSNNFNFFNINKTNLLLICVGIFMVGLLFFMFFHAGATGRATLELKTTYTYGGPIEGKILFTLQEGELIPSESVLKVNLGSNNYDYPISQLIDGGALSGVFFDSDTNLSGSGEGYGLIGKKSTFPEVNFEIRVFDEGAKEENRKKDKEEEKVTNETDATDNPSETPNPEHQEETVETPVSEQETLTPSVSKEPLVSVPSVPEQLSESNVQSGESNEQPASAESPSEQGSSTLTGSAISEFNEGRIITGRVKKGKDFIYEIAEGENVEIAHGSVKVDGADADDDIVKVKIKYGKVDVSTEYELTQEGFGEEFLGEKEKTLNIDLALLNLSVAGDRIVVSLVYGDDIIASVEKELNVLVTNETTSNETQIINETQIVYINETRIINLTGIRQISKIPTIRLNPNSSTEIILSNYLEGAESYLINEIENISSEIKVDVLTLGAEEGASGVRKGKIIAYSGNETLESNEFNILISLRAMKITTLRSNITLGQTVKWTKNVSLETPESAIVELPKGAENISVEKVDGGKKSKVDAEINAYKGNVLTGQAIKNVDNGDKGIISIIGRLFSRLTGRVIGDGEETLNDSIAEVIGAPVSSEEVQVILQDNATEYVIEYYTDAPQSNELQKGKNKQVVISGPDGLNYTDVLSFTNITEVYSVDEQERIKVYWVENNSHVEFDAYDLDGNGKLDYIEWITSHLSNQTFEIILITKAEHLDENRTYFEDVYEYVSARDDNWTTIPDEHYVRVTFEHNLTMGKDITLYARGNNSRIEVYRENDDELVVEFENVSNAGWYKVYLSSLQENEVADSYLGGIIVSGAGIKETVGVIIEIKERSPLFDVQTNVLNEVVRPGEKIRANITITNMGDLENFDVSLYYALRDFDNKTYAFREESLAIDKSTSVIKELRIPIGVAYGQYVFYSKVSYNNISAASVDSFEVGEEAKAKVTESKIFWVVITFVVVFVLVGAIVSRLSHKKRKRVIVKKKKSKKK